MNADESAPGTGETPVSRGAPTVTRASRPCMMRICVHLRSSAVLILPSNAQTLPADEPFDRFVLGQAEFVVELRGRAVAFFGALPEFAVVETGEERLVLLALVLEDRNPL